MILVLLGTQDKSFERLLKQVEKLKKENIIKEEIIVQAGYTKYESNCMNVFDFVSNDELNNFIKAASLIITHGGVGSILDGLRKKKTMIVAPRLKEYKEHTNNHQLQIIKRFADMEYILPLTNFNKLEKTLDKAKSFKPKKYKGNNDKILNLIEDFIDNL